jgi:hypothetical protein
MEYVRVCDAYGTGFFYIPGTETCLRVGGVLRFEKNYEKAKNGPASYEWHTRARIEVEAKNDSEWGTVYSWIRLQGDSYNNSAETPDAGGNQTRWWYYFGIGGLEFGRYDAPGTRFQGYGGRTDWGAYYGNDTDQQYVSYTFNYDNFSAFVAIENDLVNGVNYAPNTQIDGYDTDGDGVADQFVKGREYMPNVSAGVKGTFGGYEVGAFIGYDESIESINVRKWVRGDIGMFGFTLMGLYADDARNEYFNYDGFSGILGLSAKVTDTVTVSKDIQWWDDDSWRVIGDVAWDVAPGFSVLLEASYGDGKQVGDQVKTGMLRFQRSF